MRLAPTIVLLFAFPVLFGQPKLVQYTDRYDLKGNPIARDLGRSVVEGVLNGTLPTFRQDSAGINQISGDEARRRLILYEAQRYEPWRADEDYYSNDRVTFESQTWEALLDSKGRRPEENDFWMKVNVGDTYFPSSELSQLQIQFDYVGKQRHYIWIHFAVPAEAVPEGMERYIFSFRFRDFDNFMNRTSIAFYQLTNAPMGWLGESTFSFFDGYYQAKLRRALCQYAFQNKNNSTIYLSQDSLLLLFKKADPEIKDTFQEDNFGSGASLEQRWKNNSIDSLRIFHADYTSRQPFRRIADVPFKKFVPQLNDGGKSRFRGFYNFSGAISAGILKPYNTDTVANSSTREGVNMPSKAKPLVGSFTALQRSQYYFNLPQNRRLLTPDDPFGKYVLNAITTGKFKDAYKAFNNDSLKSRLSDAEVQMRIILQPSPSFPVWDIGANYITEDIVMYERKTYRCLRDNIDHDPPKFPEDWQRLEVPDVLFAPSDFSLCHVAHRIILNEKGQVTARYPEAFSLYAYDEPAQAYKPLMTVDAETMKRILTDNSVGASGALYWEMFQKDTLSGFYDHNTSILKK